MLKRLKYASCVALIAALLFLTSNLLVTADATFQNSTIIDGRSRPNVKEPTVFKFSAKNICNENIGKNGLCLDIWGKGSTSANTITANGGYETYRGKPVDLNKGKWLQLSKGQWSAVNLLASTEKQITFKAVTSSGIVFIKLTEGKSEKSGQVCAYGPLIAIQKAEDALCVKNVLVVIGK